MNEHDDRIVGQSVGGGMPMQAASAAMRLVGEIVRRLDSPQARAASHPLSHDMLWRNVSRRLGLPSGQAGGLRSPYVSATPPVNFVHRVPSRPEESEEAEADFSPQPPWPARRPFFNLVGQPVPVPLPAPVPAPAPTTEVVPSPGPAPAQVSAPVPQADISPAPTASTAPSVPTDAPPLFVPAKVVRIEYTPGPAVIPPRPLAASTPLTALLSPLPSSLAAQTATPQVTVARKAATQSEPAVRPGRPGHIEPAPGAAREVAPPIDMPVRVTRSQSSDTEDGDGTFSEYTEPARTPYRYNPAPPAPQQPLVAQPSSLVERNTNLGETLGRTLTSEVVARSEMTQTTDLLTRIASTREVEVNPVPTAPAVAPAPELAPSPTPQAESTSALTPTLAQDSSPAPTPAATPTVPVSRSAPAQVQVVTAPPADATPPLLMPLAVAPDTRIAQKAAEEIQEQEARGQFGSIFSRVVSALPLPEAVRRALQPAEAPPIQAPAPATASAPSSASETPQQQAVPVPPLSDVPQAPLAGTSTVAAQTEPAYHAAPPAATPPAIETPGAPTVAVPAPAIPFTQSTAQAQPSVQAQVGDTRSLEVVATNSAVPVPAQPQQASQPQANPSAPQATPTQPAVAVQPMLADTDAPLARVQQPLVSAEAPAGQRSQGLVRSLLSRVFGSSDDAQTRPGLPQPGPAPLQMPTARTPRAQAQEGEGEPAEPTYLPAQTGRRAAAQTSTPNIVGQAPVAAQTQQASQAATQPEPSMQAVEAVEVDPAPIDVVAPTLFAPVASPTLGPETAPAVTPATVPTPTAEASQVPSLTAQSAQPVQSVQLAQAAEAGVAQAQRENAQVEQSIGATSSQYVPSLAPGEDAPVQPTLPSITVPAPSTLEFDTPANAPIAQPIEARGAAATNDVSAATDAYPNVVAQPLITPTEAPASRGLFSTLVARLLGTPEAPTANVGRAASPPAIEMPTARRARQEAEAEGDEAAGEVAAFQPGYTPQTVAAGARTQEQTVATPSTGTEQPAPAVPTAITAQPTPITPDVPGIQVVDAAQLAQPTPVSGMVERLASAPTTPVQIQALAVEPQAVTPQVSQVGAEAAVPASVGEARSVSQAQARPESADTDTTVSSPDVTVQPLVTPTEAPARRGLFSTLVARLLGTSEAPAPNVGRESSLPALDMPTARRATQEAASEEATAEESLLPQPQYSPSSARPVTQQQPVEQPTVAVTQATSSTSFDAPIALAASNVSASVEGGPAIIPPPDVTVEATQALAQGIAVEPTMAPQPAQASVGADTDVPVVQPLPLSQPLVTPTETPARRGLFSTLVARLLGTPDAPAATSTQGSVPPAIEMPGARRARQDTAVEGEAGEQVQPGYTTPSSQAGQVRARAQETPTPSLAPDQQVAPLAPQLPLPVEAAQQAQAAQVVEPAAVRVEAAPTIASVQQPSESQPPSYSAEQVGAQAVQSVSETDAIQQQGVEAPAQPSVTVTREVLVPLTGAGELPAEYATWADEAWATMPDMAEELASLHAPLTSAAPLGAAGSGGLLSRLLGGMGRTAGNMGGVPGPLDTVWRATGQRMGEAASSEGMAPGAYISRGAGLGGALPSQSGLPMVARLAGNAAPGGQPAASGEYTQTPIGSGAGSPVSSQGMVGSASSPQVGTSGGPLSLPYYSPSALPVPQGDRSTYGVQPSPFGYGPSNLRPFMVTRTLGQMSPQLGNYMVSQEGGEGESEEASEATRVAEILQRIYGRDPGDPNMPLAIPYGAFAMPAEGEVTPYLLAAQWLSPEDSGGPGGLSTALSRPSAMSMPVPSQPYSSRGNGSSPYPPVPDRSYSWSVDMSRAPSGDGGEAGAWANVVASAVDGGSSPSLALSGEERPSAQGGQAAEQPTHPSLDDAGPDLDEMAETIYSIIRRRLAVERERFLA